MSGTDSIPRPCYGVTDLQAGLAWHWRGFHLSEKMDGVWHSLRIGRSVIIGELMRDGRFFAFDLPRYDDRDLRGLPLQARLERLDTFPLARPQTPRPGETPGQFLRRVLAAGGEGMVGARLDAPWGVDVFKCKRVETFDCTVTERHTSRQSVRLAMNSEDCGWCPCFGCNFHRVRPGDVVEVAAFGRHASGKFREPRLVRIRPDKITSRDTGPGA